MIEAYPSKNETLRLLGVIRPEKRSETPVPEIALPSSIQVETNAALQGVVIDDRAGWLEGEWRVYGSLSEKGKRVWQYLKVVNVTRRTPLVELTSFLTGVSEKTAAKTLRRFRAFHGIE